MSVDRVSIVELISIIGCIVHEVEEFSFLYLHERLR